MRTIYEIWEAIAESDGCSQIALLRKGEIEKEALLFEGKPRLLKTFEANSYNEACQAYNDFFGWGKYHPMDDDLGDCNGDENL
ncbi:hypothetical protein D9X30_5550 [Cupriavidus sp. U2]|uniref:hypothetical protein n=1 Tax=Cupriavidus sp. U2 TaxID=2920269 RepID=UPI00129E96C6|nr:hypothetical protein [Cupriavidus sp. U2]KAI3589967.1 hypothetical protein D9X30_5550 [Cupriavidus sp. U2]